MIGYVFIRVWKMDLRRENSGRESSLKAVEIVQV